MTNASKLIQASAGNAGGEILTVEDVFSTYLYTGTGSTQAITNGIDLDGEGGLVWTKGRSSVIRHSFFDTERGANKYLMSNTNDAQTTVTDQLMSFNSDGFTLGADASTGVNGSGTDYVSWTFRKQAGFFDVVTYTGTGSAQTIAHNLGSVPGCIIIKRTDTSGYQWLVYHRSLGASTRILLNSTGASSASNNFNNTAPTDSVFSVGGFGDDGASGGTYVAYLFAHDDQSFGDNSNESIIKCGSYTGTGAAGNTVDFGFEPQWVLIKNTQAGTKSWHICDMMRGLNYSTDYTLSPNTSSAETNWGVVKATPTGVLFTDGDDNFNSAHTFIYIAIRRPMKTPESGTEVFDMAYADATPPRFNSSFPVDMAFYNYLPGGNKENYARLISGKRLRFNLTDAEISDTYAKFDYQDGYNSQAVANSSVLSWMFKRATGFFDVVAYTGTAASEGTAVDIQHNLGVVPEFIITKKRNATGSFFCYHKFLTATDYISLNSTIGTTSYANMWDNTEPTDSVFTTAYQQLTSATYIAYLFATVAGVSKVGSYTGTGSNVDVDCGFSAGARFILIKRTDSTGDWYVWDSERGIVAGNDPYLLLNSTAAEVTSTDYIDPLSSGFTVTSSAPAALNTSGGSYIFLAIA